MVAIIGVHVCVWSDNISRFLLGLLPQTLQTARWPTRISPDSLSFFTACLETKYSTSLFSQTFHYLANQWRRRGQYYQEGEPGKLTDSLGAGAAFLAFRRETIFRNMEVLAGGYHSQLVIYERYNLGLSRCFTRQTDSLF